MTQETKHTEQRSQGTNAPPRRRHQEIGSLEVWARSAPIRLAGYEDDLAEPHILPGVD